MQLIRNRISVAALVLALASLAAAPGRAVTIYTGSSGNLSAQAQFDLSGSTLTITLTNTSAADVLVPSDVLTGLFFDATHTLTPVSAGLNGSALVYGSVVNNVGEGWQYKGGVSAQGKNAGISAAGLGIFGPKGNFYTTGTTLGGLDYGILSAGDDTSTGNTGVTGKGPLIKNALVFTLTAASGFSLDELGDSVVFQYGTDTSEPHFLGTLPPKTTGGDPPAAVPEPAAYQWALVMGLFGLGWFVTARRRLA